MDERCVVLRCLVTPSGTRESTSNGNVPGCNGASVDPSQRGYVIVQHRDIVRSCCFKWGRPNSLRAEHSEWHHVHTVWATVRIVSCRDHQQGGRRRAETGLADFAQVRSSLIDLL